MGKGHTPTSGVRRGSLHLVKPETSESEPASPAGTLILIVDDEGAIRDLLRSAFEAEGYHVLAAGDGEAALALYERYQPEAILLDLMMPRLDGLGFLHEFRRRFPAADPPIFVMSAVRTASEHARAAGVDGFFAKPFDLDQVIETVAASLRGRQQRRASGPHTDSRGKSDASSEQRPCLQA